MNGSIDPFVKVGESRDVYEGSAERAHARCHPFPQMQASYGGSPVKATTARYATAAPVWYETLSLPVTIPLRPGGSGEPLFELAPQLHVELWDENALLNNAFGERGGGG